MFSIFLLISMCVKSVAAGISEMVAVLDAPTQFHGQELS